VYLEFGNYTDSLPKNYFMLIYLIQFQRNWKQNNKGDFMSRVIIALILMFCCGCGLKKPVTVTIPNTTIQAKVPRLTHGGYLADPDNLLGRSGRKETVAFLRRVENKTGIKVIVSIQNSLPKGLAAEFQFISNRAATRLLSQYVRIWQEGSQAPASKPESMVLLIVTKGHGLSISGSKEAETKLSDPKMVPALLKAQSAFFKTRTKIRRSKIKGASPDLLATIAYIEQFQELLAIISKNPPPP